MKKLKKYFVQFLAGLLVLSSVATGFASEGKGPFQLREVVERMGGEIYWHDTERVIEILLENGVFLYDLNEERIYRNGIPVPVSDMPEIINGVTYVQWHFLNDVLALNDDYTSFPVSKETKILNENLIEIRESLKSYLSHEHINELFSGQVLIALNEDILVHQAYGKSNYQNGANASILDTYSIGSVTKQMTALGIMMLENQGLLSYDDLIEKYLPDVPYGDLITIEQLLTHTSGLPEYTDVLLIGENFDSYEEIIQYVESHSLYFEPGTGFKYCNTGYYLLGEIVAQISGMTLFDYLTEIAFEPLNMEHTHWAYENGDLKMTAQGSIQGDVEVAYLMDSLLLSMAGGAGAIASNVGDLYAWQYGLYENILLDEEALNLMKGHLREDLINPHFGFGLIHEERELGYEFGHGGNTIGFTALTSYYEPLSLHVLILSNKGQVALGGIKDNIFKIVQGEEVNLDLTEYIDLSEEQLALLTGTYKNDTLPQIEIAVKEGQLMLQVQGQGAFPLYALSPVSFENKMIGIEVVFDNPDLPTQFTLLQNGFEFQLMKILE